MRLYLFIFSFWRLLIKREELAKKKTYKIQNREKRKDEAVIISKLSGESGCAYA